MSWESFWFCRGQWPVSSVNERLGQRVAYAKISFIARDKGTHLTATSTWRSVGHGPSVVKILRDVKF